MLDEPVRAYIGGPLNVMGTWIGARGVTPTALTLFGFALGLAACAAIAYEQWIAALVLWLLNRAADGLDGPVARNGPHGSSELGGFVDIMADFAIYGGVIVAVGYAIPEARLAASVLLLTYYLNGSAFLAWSSLAERRDGGDGERSLSFPGGLAEGTETILVYVVLLLFPGRAVLILSLWAVAVGITVVQRLIFVGRYLQNPHLGSGTV